MYHSFIMANFSYCPLTWHFCSEKYTKKIEKIQLRALRFIYNDCESLYEKLLERSKLPSLKTRRMRLLALEIFKIINKKSHSFSQIWLKLKKTYNFRYSKAAEISRPKTTRYGKGSFRYEAARAWYTLPNDIRNSTSLN